MRMSMQLFPVFPECIPTKAYLSHPHSLAGTLITPSEEAQCEVRCEERCYEGEWLPASDAAPVALPYGVAHYHEISALRRRQRAIWEPQIDEWV